MTGDFKPIRTFMNEHGIYVEVELNGHIEIPNFKPSDFSIEERDLRMSKTNVKVESNEWARMYSRLHNMDSESLKVVWSSLRTYDPSANYAPGIGMDAWAEAVYNEMTRRNLPVKENIDA